MIALAGLLVLVAGALLVGGLGDGDSTLLWASVGVSVLAAVVLVLQTVRRRRTAGVEGPEDDRADADRASTPADGRAAAPGADPAEVRPATESATSGATSTGRSSTDAPAVEQVAPDPADGVGSEPTGAGRTHATTGSAPPTADRPASAQEGGAHDGPPPLVPGPSTGSHAVRPAAEGPADGEPVEEIVEVTDLLLVLDLTDEVVVVDEHPRYHLAGCSQTAGQEEIGLPLTEAREDGFTACGVCRPDRHLADAERRRRAAAR